MKLSKKSIIFIVIGVVIVAIALLLFLNMNQQTTEETTTLATDDTINVIMEVNGGQQVEIELYPDIAPKTVENFVNLVNEGFYDGLTFHRVIPGFMIQGGDPNGNGTGGSDETVVGEFLSNGYDNDLSHERGVISMARTNEPNSATSQFFIVTDDSPFLDGNYAAFGRVISGMDEVDKIVSVQTDSMDKPIEDQIIERIYIEE